MMSSDDIIRFKPGRKFSSIMNGSIWNIDNVDIDDDVLFVTDTNGFSCRIFTLNFDKHHYFLDDLPTGWLGDNSEPPKPKCECGSEKVGVDRHSDYCPKYQKETT